jgi:CRISPR-associated exonuclease Cas4
MPTDDHKDSLPLSGIQHFAFCPRQWALIHIEGIWVENFLTAQGRVMHDKVDDPWFNEMRKGMVTSRSMPVVSKELGLYGVADLVELIPDDQGVPVPGRRGLWRPRPVEYKRGKPKDDDCDAVQLCAQAVCLEEMLDVIIENGDIFYGQIRRRTIVDFNGDLRDKVHHAAKDMHRHFEANLIPLAKKEKKCRACSLIDACNPELLTLKGSVAEYIHRELDDARP